MGRTISFTLKYIEIRKHFLKYHPPHPPGVPAKAFACICVTIFYTLYGSGLLAQGGERCSAAPKPRAQAHKMTLLTNKKLMTVMKFSRTNLLNCFVFCASLIKSTLRLKVELARLYAFFQKKKSHCYSQISHSFANVLYLSICMLGKYSCFYFRLLTFFKIKFLKINHLGPQSECQTVWIQIKTDILLVLIWVQTVCKMLLVDDTIIHCHAKSYSR